MLLMNSIRHSVKWSYLFRILISFVFVYFLYGETSFADDVIQQENNTTATSDNKPLANGKNAAKQVYVINEQLKHAVALSKTTPLAGEKLLAQWLEKVGTAQHQNAAEKYLVLLTKARIALHKKQLSQAITSMEQAKVFEKTMSVKQLQTPLFNELYFLLGESYAKADKYKQAFINKKKFLGQFFDYHQAQSQQVVAKLNEKYQMDLKQNENELLKQDNQLEQTIIEQREQEAKNRQYNMILIGVVCVVFLILLYRQLLIRIRLKRINQLDSLTQLKNRRVLFEQGEVLFLAAKKHNQPFGVCLFDIDHFKSVNDTFGHQVGDKVLIEIAQLAKESMRSRDLLARIGGEEFVALLSGATLTESKATAERLREKINSYPFSDVPKDHPISASFGIVMYSDQFTSFDTLLDAADEAMYQAKEQGRNCVQVYQQPKN